MITIGQPVEIIAIIGFLLAAYAIVANDTIQTLGTFLASNARRSWWVLWLFASTIIIAVMAMGYQGVQITWPVQLMKERTVEIIDEDTGQPQVDGQTGEPRTESQTYFAPHIVAFDVSIGHQGDVAYGRLNQIPYPEMREDEAPGDGDAVDPSTAPTAAPTQDPSQDPAQDSAAEDDAATDTKARPQWLAAIDPPGGVEWYHVLPPIVLLVLTRLGVPVSTTFLVLTIFTLTTAASSGVFQSMLIKSGLGYLVAFGAGAVVYIAVSRFFERWVSNTKDRGHSPVWFVLQWMATSYLWWQWLAQDLANIFVFLPRTTETIGDATTVTFDPTLVIVGTAVMVLLHAYIFYTRGGEIQKIVLTKTNTTDIRAATLVDFIYGTILLIFKEISDIPMSTTWVFLGLLAGRELAISAVAQIRGFGVAVFDVVSDIMRALIGLFISIFLAVSIPKIAGSPNAADIGYPVLAALVAAAFGAWGIMWMLRSRADAANVEGR